MLLQPDYFTKVNGQTVSFADDFLRPFMDKYGQSVSKVNTRVSIFIQNTPMNDIPQWRPKDVPNVVNASHWYDYFAIFTGMFLSFFTMDFYENGRFVFGQKKGQQLRLSQLTSIKKASEKALNGIPTLIGEFGVRFSMPLNLSFLLNWFGMQEKALDASFRALEELKLNATIWNYTPGNTNKDGDHWNYENLSIISRDFKKGKGLLANIRIAKALVRPYPIYIAGVLDIFSFNYRTGKFQMAFTDNGNMEMESVIFVPELHYASKPSINVSDGSYEFDSKSQVLKYRPSQLNTQHFISIEKN